MDGFTAAKVILNHRLTNPSKIDSPKIVALTAYTDLATT